MGANLIEAFSKRERRIEAHLKTIPEASPALDREGSSRSIISWNRTRSFSSADQMEKLWRAFYENIF